MSHLNKRTDIKAGMDIPEGTNLQLFIANKL
jgi:hypothetical protein